MKAIVFFILFLISNIKLIAQSPIIQWQKSLGGSEIDDAHFITNSNEGGFVLIGSSESGDGDVTNHHPAPPGFTSGDMWLVKLDSLGGMIWNECYGGEAGEDGNSFIQKTDGGFVLTGYTNSDDGDVVGHHDVDDFWVVETDSAGNFQWQKCLGGSEQDNGNDIIQTADSGYLILGTTFSIDGDVIGNHGLFDFWIVKLNHNGIKQWTKCFGGTGRDEGTYIKQVRDGGFLMAGSTSSTNGDVSGFHGPLSSDIWIAKIDSSAHIQWQKCFGGTAGEDTRGIILSDDGGYYILGGTLSNDGDVSNLLGGVDYWLIKIDSVGNILWNKCYGGIYNEYLGGGCATSDGGIVMVGYANMDDSMVSGTHAGVFDEWVAKVDSAGNFEWGKCLGGTGEDKAYSVCETPDGGLLVAGSTTSSDGDVTFNHGKKDVWVVKLAPPGLSVKEMGNTLMDFTIFQNNDQLSLRYFSKQNESAKVFVFDNSGKQVFEKNISVSEGINYSQINCADFAKGIYVVKIDVEKNSMSEKVLIR